MTVRESRPSPAALGRSMGFERGLVVLLGLLALLTGVAVVLVSAGVFGAFRAQRPILDPLAVQWLRANPQQAIPFAIVLGVVLVMIGLWWVTHALRPEIRPDLHLDTESPGDLTVTSSALTEAIRSDAESLTGVTQARVRMAGSSQEPTLRMTLALQEGTNVRQVWEELDHTVLSRARAALEAETIPTAIRLVLDRAPRQRVR